MTPEIAFLLPGVPHIPTGGLRVAYEYANGLARRGFAVTLVHPTRSLPPLSVRDRAHRRIRQRPPSDPWHWFEFEPSVEIATPSRISAETVQADAVIATAWRTAEPAARIARDHGAAGLYLIQGHETWDGPASDVDASWCLPLHKVVIAQWLLDIAIRLGQADHTTYIPNGLDFELFPLRTPIEGREPAHVGAILRDGVWKGGPDAIRALGLARQKKPDLRATMFGPIPAPDDLPDWVRYIRSPSQEGISELYNEFAIFLHASHSEGWPLPPAEAMASGCALVAAANAGVTDYATEDNSRLVPVGQPDLLAQAVVELTANPDRRIELARRGHEAISAYTWPRAIDAFSRVLHEQLSLRRS